MLAWSPGLVIPRCNAGFFRYSRSQNTISHVKALFALIARDLLRLTETPQRAGTLLAGLASISTAQPSGFQNWSNRLLGPGRLRFEISQPSAEACSDSLALQLWDLSARLGGIG